MTRFPWRDRTFGSAKSGFVSVGHSHRAGFCICGADRSTWWPLADNSARAAGRRVPICEPSALDPTEPDRSPQVGPQAWTLRLGCLAELASASAPASASNRPLGRGDRVLVRTSRGVELGELVSPVRWNFLQGRQGGPSPQILRRTTPQDELLIRRLDRHRCEAVEACRDAIRSAGIVATLLDVDHLFDGGTLLLHFLGDVPEQIDAITGDIVRQYEAVVRTGEFAELLETGCGPGCGTDAAKGCVGCVSCAAHAACRTAR
ncbi:hypothetical protein V7x_16480 [Crateriforma conspicua]|uniref:PSP1 C-terminal domain-containing protein n=1 Tax=Crateriforma conspicua TaxID=2527996 RepID=A0A5C6FUQ9_9PLAN|nr:hypothetical protein V7x_16480 [Crateriforma conspicua]